MKEIIDWLITVEHLANDFYFKAAQIFPEDKGLTIFLNHLAEDEAYHYHIMASAAEYVLRAKTQKEAAIRVDDSIKEKIEAPFKNNLVLASARTLTREALIDCIITSEYSEWNEIFVYVVNSIKEEDRVFEHAASKIQHHLKHIEHYLSSTDYGKQQLAGLKKIPQIWKERILIVDDDETITALLAAVLERDWAIDTAPDGAAALAKIRANFYDLIISDIDMPIMDGFELFKQASAIIDNLNNMFVFHTGNVSPARKEYFAQNNLRFLAKPTSIKEIREFVQEMIRALALGKQP